MPSSHRSFWDQRFFPPFKMACLLQTARDLEISLEDALPAIGFNTPGEVDDPHRLTSVRDYVHVCGRVSTHGLLATELALKTGSRMHLSAYGMYGYALLCSPTMADFFETGRTFHALGAPTLRIAWRTQSSAIVWEFHHGYADPSLPHLRRFLVTQQAAQHATHVQDVLGRGIHPDVAYFSFSDEGSRTLYEAVLGCRCHFDQDVDELHFARSILDREPLMANRMAHRIALEACTHLLQQASAAGTFKDEVARLVAMADDLNPTMAQIGALLNMTERTLRRRLMAEDTHFRDIVDEARRDAALQHVMAGRLTTEEIAARLGYGDVSNFRKAFHRWTGGSLRAQRAKPRPSDAM